ncbi:hypothetical protein LXA43DRAFT_1183245 [Ganoderma leucocontextum]|nr:hypothetical protein LXA43DRAFT_1183245 [Ganoderma leucocontextum]
MDSLPVRTPRVPLEIQLSIVEMCPDVRTRLTLVSTHKELRKHGARLALRLPSARVRLFTESTARSFFAFCAARGLPRQPSSPLALLHTLDITLATVNPADIGNLITLLANVPKLTSLTLRDPEKVLLHQCSLYVALQRLRTLTTFRVHKAGPIAYKLVSEITSALEDVAISPRCEPVCEDDDSYGELNLNKVLPRHKDTLRRVCVRCANVLEDEDEFEGDLVVFEKVRQLMIPESVASGAADYIRAFPNVVSLDVGNILTTEEKRLSAKLEDIREENLSILLDELGQELGWCSLERVRGGLLDLYVFGNICRTVVLEIDGLIKDDWACIPEVVSYHCARVVRLSVSPSLQVDVWEKNRHRMRTVQCLALQFVVEDQVDLKQLTDTAIRAAGSFVRCGTVFLDFTAQKDAARDRLRDIDHLSLRRIIEDPRSGPSEIAIHSPVEMTYWRHRPGYAEKWEVWHMPATTEFEIEGAFPEGYVSDWL